MLKIYCLACALDTTFSQEDERVQNVLLFDMTLLSGLFSSQCFESSHKQKLMSSHEEASTESAHM